MKDSELDAEVESIGPVHRTVWTVILFSWIGWFVYPRLVEFLIPDSSFVGVKLIQDRLMWWKIVYSISVGALVGIVLHGLGARQKGGLSLRFRAVITAVALSVWIGGVLLQKAGIWYAAKQWSLLAKGRSWETSPIPLLIKPSLQAPLMALMTVLLIRIIVYQLWKTRPPVPPQSES